MKMKIRKPSDRDAWTYLRCVPIAAAVGQVKQNRQKCKTEEKERCIKNRTEKKKITSCTLYPSRRYSNTKAIDTSYEKNDTVLLGVPVVPARTSGS